VHREEIYQRIQHERAMHEHLQHLDQDYQLSFEEDNNDFTRHNNFNR
jgi:sRNA-binding carbon storage regulator CsrA